MSASTAASLPQAQTNVNFFAEPHGNGPAGMTMATTAQAGGLMGPPPPLRPPPQTPAGIRPPPQDDPDHFSQRSGRADIEHLLS